MKLVTMTGLLSERFGIEKGLEMISAAQFDGFDYTMGRALEWKLLTEENCWDYVRKIKNTAKRLGLPCLQSHTPFPKVPDKISAEDYIPMTLHALEIASELECPLAVVHPANIYTAEKNIELIYSKIIPVAERLGVKVATENMWGWNKEHTEFVPEACGTAEDFEKTLNLLPSPFFTGCVDIGHAQMKNAEGAVSMIKALGRKRIGALHVHDNDLVNDNHSFPFAGKSKWTEIMTALAEIGYQNEFTFEADAFMRQYPNELLSPCLNLLYETGRYLIRIFKKKKQEI